MAKKSENKRLTFSIVIPYFDEEDSLAGLVVELAALNRDDFEVIWVDDGSRDRSFEMLQKSLEKSKVGFTSQLIRHKRRLGKGKSLSDGIQVSNAELLIFLDADGQDDPALINKFIEKIDSGADLVVGWRKNRLDGANKTFPSRIANKLLWQTLLKTKLHDINCGFKAIKKSIFSTIPLYGDNYRFLPILADKSGFLVDEVEVVHRPRVSGVSKYGPLRIWSGLLDTLTTYFIVKFAERPLHLFGSIAALLGGIGLVILMILSFERIFLGELLYRRPMLLAGIMLVILAVQIFTTGLIAELMLWEKRKSSIIKQ